MRSEDTHGNGRPVRAQPRPLCLLCGSPGKTAYTGLTDVIFGSHGDWTLNRCPRSDCGVLWLDPMPVEDELATLYEQYYTHAGQDTDGDGGTGAWGLIGRAHRMLLKLTGLKRQRARLAGMYLQDRKPGRVLDVGCGNGDRLSLLQDMGWEVEGQEIDPAACAAARARSGAIVHAGPLEKLGLSEAAYDAIVMNHVIEHIPDPAALLVVCHSLLKPGGWLVLTTPNARSLGLRRFGRHWRGLEVPRHLYLFTPDALASLVSAAGFRQPEVWTSAARAGGIAQASMEIRDSGSHHMGTRPGISADLVKALLFYQPAFSLASLLLPKSGDECVVRAVR